MKIEIELSVKELEEMATKQVSTGKSLYAQLGTWTRPQRSSDQAVAYTPPTLNIDADVVSGSLSIDVTGDTVVQITGGAENQWIVIAAKQDGTGGHSFSPHASLKDPQGRLAEVITDPDSTSLITCLFHDGSWWVVSSVLLGV